MKKAQLQIESTLYIAIIVIIALFIGVVFFSYVNQLSHKKDFYLDIYTRDMSFALNSIASSTGNIKYKYIDPLNNNKKALNKFDFNISVKNSRVVMNEINKNLRSIYGFGNDNNYGNLFFKGTSKEKIYIIKSGYNNSVNGDYNPDYIICPAINTSGNKNFHFIFKSENIDFPFGKKGLVIIMNEKDIKDVVAKIRINENSKKSYKIACIILDNIKKNFNDYDVYIIPENDKDDEYKDNVFVNITIPNSIKNNIKDSIGKFMLDLIKESTSEYFEK